MNSVTALLSHSSQTSQQLPAKGKAKGGFQQLLTTLQSEFTGRNLEQVMTNGKTDELLKKLQTLLNDAGIDMKTLFTDLSRSDNNLEMLNRLKAELEHIDFPSAETKSDLIGVIEEISIDMQKLQVFTMMNNHNLPEMLPESSKVIHADPVGQLMAQGKNVEQLQTLWIKFQKLVKPLIDDSVMKQFQMLNRSELLAVKNVLQEVAGLMKQLPADGKQKLENAMRNSSSFDQKLFGHLLQSMQKRLNVPASYNKQQPVKSADIGKWISTFVEKQQTQENSLHKSAGSIYTMPMTKVEQYVVHVNQNQSQPQAQKQLIQEFERIIASSRMFQNRAGGMEMHLKLRPGNLGDMMVKMIQMNGETVVKIMVSTAAAKDMLEGNMSQIRHMFSPQQVIIEKHEPMSSQQSFLQEHDRGNGEQDEQKNDYPSHNESHHDQQHEEEELSFHDVLMNEKV